MIHGGGHVTVQNNIIVNTAEGQVEQTPIPRVWKYAPAGKKIQQNIFVTTEEWPVYAHRDDNVGNHKVLYANNLIYTAGTEPFVQMMGPRARTKSWSEWRTIGHDKGSIITDPLFNDFEGGDYTLQENSPALNWDLSLYLSI